MANAHVHDFIVTRVQGLYGVNIRSPERLAAALTANTTGLDACLPSSLCQSTHLVYSQPKTLITDHIHSFEHLRLLARLCTLTCSAFTLPLSLTPFTAIVKY